MPVVDNKDILLLIITFRVRGIPHSRYRSSICFVYSIGPKLPGPCDYIRSLPVGLEFCCREVRSILKNFPHARLDRPAGTPKASLVCYKSLPSGVGRTLLGLLPLPVARHLRLTP